MARALLPPAHLKVRIGPRSHERTYDFGLPLNGSAETIIVAAMLGWSHINRIQARNTISGRAAHEKERVVLCAGSLFLSSRFPASNRTFCFYFYGRSQRELDGGKSGVQP